ncbi:MAG: hypothetical protein J3R72DRAFT_452450 [Linnemannia gamsii]|nr:MAG: hypothetical protein J3R72DRAFT_452450 [Linnemannia gamsii]
MRDRVRSKSSTFQIGNHFCFSSLFSVLLSMSLGYPVLSIVVVVVVVIIITIAPFHVRVLY